MGYFTASLSDEAYHIILQLNITVFAYLARELTVYEQLWFPPSSNRIMARTHALGK